MKQQSITVSTTVSFVGILGLITAFSASSHAGIRKNDPIEEKIYGIYGREALEATLSQENLYDLVNYFKPKLKGWSLQSSTSEKTSSGAVFEIHLKNEEQSYWSSWVIPSQVKIVSDVQVERSECKLTPESATQMGYTLRGTLNESDTIVSAGASGFAIQICFDEISAEPKNAQVNLKIESEFELTTAAEYLMNDQARNLIDAQIVAWSTALIEATFKRQTDIMHQRLGIF